MSRDLGDFQTPEELVRAIKATLVRQGVEWDRVLEPTCGEGRFLTGLGKAGANSEFYGIELQASYVEAARQRVSQAGIEDVRIIQASVFDVDLSEIPWRNPGRLLVVGNPPWVTNSELGSLHSENLPAKSNLKLLSGLDAMTGASNFDLTEFIWIKVLEELRPQDPVVCFLCKSQVARNVLEYARERQIGVEKAALYRVDAKRWFGASVDACVLVLALDRRAKGVESVEVFDSPASGSPSGQMRFNGRELVHDVPQVRGLDIDHFLGPCDFEWRQGIKHDAARVMELRLENDRWVNGLGEVVEVEPKYVYPLLKGSDLYHGRGPHESAKAVVVPQQTLGESTDGLANHGPKLWEYLHRYAEILDGRRSSIYRTQPRFSVFGIGPYSFAPYKVAVSGLHKVPRFRLVGPSDSRPVMVDDTCYFLALQDAQQAALLAAILQSPIGMAVVGSLLFTDSKRPVKKRMLRRIDLRAILRASERDELVDLANGMLRRVARAPVSAAWPEPLERALPELPLFASAS